MDVRSRRQLVLDRLLGDGRVSVADLSGSTGVSEMTIRRDLEHLVAKGVARRVYGGAVLVGPTADVPDFGERAVANAAHKEAIGIAAASMIQDGETVVVDSGTTCVEAARALSVRSALTVCPLGFQATAVLAGRPGIDVLLPGGELHAEELSYLGPITRRMLEGFRFDSYIMSVSGVSADNGLSDAGVADADVKLAALESSRRVILVADATKLDVVAFARIAPLERVDVLVTDHRADAHGLTAIREHGVDIVIANQGVA